jgi:hypothetical protein
VRVRGCRCRGKGEDDGVVGVVGIVVHCCWYWCCWCCRLLVIMCVVIGVVGVVEGYSVVVLWWSLLLWLL